MTTMYPGEAIMRITQLSTWAITAVLFAAAIVPAAASSAFTRGAAPILVYHRFGPVATDPMTVTTPVFEEQLAWLRTHHYRIMALHDLVESLREPAKPLPSRAVSITVDDGHESAYHEMLPLIRRYRFPVTLFIYPSAISNAGYALTWDQLAEMKRTGLVDVESHTWWHPNFNHERANLSPDAYQAFAATQFVHSRELIQRRLGGAVDLLAWPYGIHDPQLQRWASQAGYIAAFTLVRRPAGRGDALLALPRYLVTDRDRGARFAAIIERDARKPVEP